MKKVLLCGLSAALILALVLAACSKPQSDQPAGPDPTPSQPVEPSDKADEAQPMTAVAEVTQEELTECFEMAYDVGQTYAVLGYDEDSLLEQELEILSDLVGGGITKWPDDVTDQYLAWREANHPREPEVTEAPSGSTQTKPVQQAPSTTNNNQQVDGNVNAGVIGNVDWDAHEIKDPGQSSVFKPMDNPWDTDYTIDYGGTGGDAGVIGNVDWDAHKGKDPGESSFFTVPDDPWSSNAKIDYGGD